MRVYDKFVIVENVNDWLNNRKQPSQGDYWLLGARIYGLSNTITEENFPIVFIRYPSFDSYSCDTLVFSPLDSVKADLITAVEKSIITKEQALKADKDFLATL